MALSSSPATVSKKKLYDTFSRLHDYLRVSLVERCNLRCQYCMPEQGIELTPSPQLLTPEEIVRVVKVFASCGVRKLRLTGGEPLLFRGIVDLVKEIRLQAPEIKVIGMTTNGILLPRYLQPLHDAGLNRLNISLDTLDESRFLLMTRRNGLAKVLDSIAMAEALGFDPVKLNCVVLRGVNTDEIGKLARMAQDRPLEVRFIEYMPFDDNAWSREKMFSFMETVDVIERELGTKLRPLPGGETAKLFAVDGFRGRIGFITSMTTHFCGTCNRLRLTADGNIKNCLFGEEEFSVRDVLRSGASDSELETLIRHAVHRKHKAHGGKDSPEAIAAAPNRPMIKIGG